MATPCFYAVSNSHFSIHSSWEWRKDQSKKETSINKPNKKRKLEKNRSSQNKNKKHTIVGKIDICINVNDTQPKAMVTIHIAML